MYLTPECSTPASPANSPTRIWWGPRAEPPAQETDRGSSLNFATRSSSVLISEAAGTTMTSYSPVSRAIGVVCSSDTGDLLVRTAPTTTRPLTISLSPWPADPANCARHLFPPAPDTCVPYMFHPILSFSSALRPPHPGK